VYDLSDAAVSRMVAQGAQRCSSVADLASRYEVIVLCLPTSADVRTVIFGSDGFDATRRPGTLIVDQTSGDPRETPAMAEALARRGVELIDAPVSGGLMGAEAGTVTIMVGGSDKQFSRVRAILSAIRPNVVHAGAVGDAHTVKLVNNLLSGAQRLLTCEALALAVKNGLIREVRGSGGIAGARRSGSRWRS